MRALTLPIMKYSERVLSRVHRSAVKTLSLLMWALAQVQEPNLSAWARRLWLYQVEPNGTKRSYSFRYKKFRIWRFLTRSVFEAEELWEAQTHHLLDPRDAPEQKGPILVTLDWTKLGKGFWGLVIALPYHGRALPLAVQVVAEGYLQNMMTDLEIELVERFLGWLSPELRHRIVILADRGFAKTELFEAIEKAEASYVIRLHRDAFVRIAGQWVELQNLPIGPGESRSYSNVAYTQEHQKNLHVAIRRLPALEANDPSDDTWYLATNRAELSEAADWYAKRFKEEELFKDLKSMLDLAAHQLKNEEGLKRLVAVVGLYYVFVVLEGQVQTTAERLRQVTQDRNGGPELGIFRQALAVLLLWSQEVESPPLDLLMPAWVQVHR
ncbi:MAG: transposase [Planctomycetes bacterium]|nr:transposase [Planctomycetota bacterium]